MSALAFLTRQECQIITSAIGVSFKILARILCTISASPDIQTLVTRPFNGRRCNAGTGFGSEEVTVACIRPWLPSSKTRHNLLSCSTLPLCTGSLWIGVCSSVPSGNVHLSSAFGLACMISWPSGPARLDANGTLKDKLTIASTAVREDIDWPFMGRLTGWAIGMSIWFGLDMRPAGVIFSRP
jgi:hypothetical protein